MKLNRPVSSNKNILVAYITRLRSANYSLDLEYVENAPR